MTDRPELQQIADNQEQGNSGVTFRMLEDSMNRIDPTTKACVKQADQRLMDTEQSEAPCYQQALKSWDNALNTNYYYLMKDVSNPEFRNDIVQAERQWVKSRDEQFKEIEMFEKLNNWADGSIPEDPSIRGLPDKVEIVKKQAQAILGIKADLMEPGTQDKPL